MDLNRRHFLRVGSLSVLAAACAPPRVVPIETLAFEPPAPGAGSAASAGAPLLVTIFLRGAADGLHLVPPTGDRGYAKLRGSLALSETLPFDGEFSLHPGLASLQPLAQRGQLAVVHACGSPDPTRSHFEAQDIMELGAPGSARLEEGWMVRGLRDPLESDAFASLALTDQQPLALRGSGAFAIGDPETFGLPGVSARAREAVEALYREARGPVGAAGAQAFGSLAAYERAMGHAPFGRRFARRGRGGPPGLAKTAAQLLAVDRSGLGVRAAFLESGDWDTHRDQGTETGQMAGRIDDLAQGISVLASGLGEGRDWLLVVMTEFGRTVRPNGSRGSDHGHGSVMLVAGPRVRGGVYGEWLGLTDANLHEGRDLPVSTDWRSVLYEVLAAHRGSAPPSDSFPDFTPQHLGLVG